MEYVEKEKVETHDYQWKIENDNGSNQKTLIARQYVENWTDMKRKNVGLLLMQRSLTENRLLYLRKCIWKRSWLQCTQIWRTKDRV